MSLVTPSLTDVPPRRSPKWQQLVTELRQRARSDHEQRMLSDCEVALNPRAEANYGA
jgi:hypothetical protein